ncbi:MAG: hypothetical protein N2234_07795, partial [Planctomycetota bacterium]|nr:hypothetical protein [Planctomycetota bacterium]
MRGNVIFFVVGMFLAAVVGVVSTFAMQVLFSEKQEEKQTSSVSETVARTVKSEVSGLKSSVDQRFNELSASLDAINGRVQSLEKSMEKSIEKLAARVASAPAVAEGGAVAPSSGSVDTETVKRVLEEAERIREEERRRQFEGFREQATKAMVERIEKFGTDKGWDAGKVEA